MKGYSQKPRRRHYGLVFPCIFETGPNCQLISRSNSRNHYEQLQVSTNNQSYICTEATKYRKELIETTNRIHIYIKISCMCVMSVE